MPIPLAALLPLVASLAPQLLGYLAGDRAGAVAQRVADAVSSVAGGTGEAEVQVALADPARAMDLRMELARIAADAQRDEHAAELERLRAELADIAGARGQTVALAQAGSRIAWMAPIVTAAVLALFGAAMWVVLTGTIPEANTRMADALLGGIYTLATTAVTYWLGTSRGAVEMRQALQDGGRPFVATEARR